MSTKKYLFLARLFSVILFIAVQFSHLAAAGIAISLSVDATESPRKILHVRETIQVKPGALTLLYPKWIPGEHGPTGPVVDVAGLMISAQGKTIPWRRDLEEMYAIHCEVPAGSNSIDLSFDFILPIPGERFSSGASSSALLLVLSWNHVVMYPNSTTPDEITVTPTLTLPEGWKYASALTTKETSNNIVRFVPTSLTMLIDSPVLTGVHLRRIDLTPPSGVPHFLDILSENEAALEMSPAQISAYRQLVEEANALFGAHHFNHYDFLYTLSEGVAHFGLEHHQSSDDRLGERTLIDSDLRKAGAGLLPHEFVHSWNGKYRRPAGLATGNFSTPMKDDMLWVYEGLTQYLGKILTARSTLQTPEEYREDLAILAARLDNRPGKTWRPLQDANDEASLLYNARADWDAWRLNVDFYDEGDLIWLEADVTIRQITGGKKSLDDFCKQFHGGESSGPVLKPYTFDDLVGAMNETAPYDWRKFFTTRLQALDAHAPLGGIEKSGWKLTYRDTPSTMQHSIDEAHKTIDLRYSIGVMMLEDGTIRDVILGSPAAKSGIAPGMNLVAVNGRKFSKDNIHDALRLAKNAPLELLCANGEYFKSYVVDYHAGERYPYLERDLSKPDLLSRIITPTSTAQKEK